MDQLDTEIFNFNLPAFKKAVKMCNDEKMEMKIIAQVKTEINTIAIRVEAKNPVHFFYLGKYFGTIKSGI